MNRQMFGIVFFWIGVLIVIALAGFGTFSLMNNLRSLTAEELSATIWALGDPLFIFWALVGQHWISWGAPR